MITSPERWMPVPNHPDYEVSDYGRVRSVDRMKVYTRRDQYSGDMLSISRRHRGKILQPGTVKSGHQLVVLTRGNPCFVHALVLTAFVGPAPEGTECCHWDDDPANNHLTNLRWGTRADNMADYERNHGHRQSVRHARS